MVISNLLTVINVNTLEILFLPQSTHKRYISDISTGSLRDLGQSWLIMSSGSTLIGASLQRRSPPGRAGANIWPTSCWGCGVRQYSSFSCCSRWLRMVLDRKWGSSSCSSTRGRIRSGISFPLINHRVNRDVRKSNSRSDRPTDRQTDRNRQGQTVEQRRTDRDRQTDRERQTETDAALTIEKDECVAVPAVQWMLQDVLQGSVEQQDLLSPLSISKTWVALMGHLVERHERGDVLHGTLVGLTTYKIVCLHISPHVLHTRSERVTDRGVRTRSRDVNWCA